jgi:glutamate dehydrogenase
MGVRAIGEHPYRRNGSARTVSIHDLELCAGRPIDIAAVGERFEETFVRIWRGTADDDSLNRLVLVGGLEWREVIVLRAYGRYMKQTLFGFDQEFISDTLFKHPETARLLIQLFVERFDPDSNGDGQALHEEILARLDRVELLNEDRILRRMLELIEATDRTNYFQRTQEGAPKDLLALKFAPHRLANIPAPVPLSESWFFRPAWSASSRRTDRARRLRWSDRLKTTAPRCSARESADRQERDHRADRCEGRVPGPHRRPRATN